MPDHPHAPESKNPLLSSLPPLPEIIVLLLTYFTDRNKHKETKLKQDKTSK